jgi:TRAP-type mannitol/chloroaromatic compound transport system substrate-binding protein
LLSWWWSNQDLYNDYLKTVGLNVISIPMGVLESEPLWSNKPIKTAKDFKGLRIRTTGLALDFYARMGASTVTMPMSEVIPSLEKGVIDATEFCLPYTDYPAGIHRTCQYVLQGLIHQPACIMEMFINRDSWNKLPDDLKQIVKYAVQVTNNHFLTDVTYYNVNTWQKMIKEGKKGGVIVEQASTELQKKFFEVGEEMANDWSKKNEWAKKFIDSQREYHKNYKSYMGPYYRNAYLQ